MRDIPVFTTEFGVASLFLKNIAYNQTAYIKIRDTYDPENLLKECCEFCCSAGAKYIFASGHKYLVRYKVHTNILRLEADRQFPATDAVLIPVTEDTLETWRKIYNEKMISVPCASQISYFEAKKYLKEDGCHLVTKNNVLIGIGLVVGNEISVVASVQQGSGRDIVAALAKNIAAETVVVHVADNNQRAIKLYENLGFTLRDTVETWYKII